MKKEKISAAIYDETKLYKELLHHQLEHSQYEVLYSSTNLKELLRYFVKYPFDILLINGRNMNSIVPACLRKLYTLAKNPLSIIFFNCNKVPNLASDIKQKFNGRIYNCDGGMYILFDTLDLAISRYKNNKPKEIMYQAILLPQQHPFYKISCNRILVEITHMLAEGKNHLQIATATSLSEHTVNTYIKNMREETECNNIPHLVSKAKACHLI
jgi:DNA-binding CsgD family transcriptional regulator